MRTNICPAFKNALPSDLQNVIRSVTKYQNRGDGSSAGEFQNDEIFLMSEMEIFGEDIWSGYTANQEQYDFYKGTSTWISPSKIYYKDTSTSEAAFWWERSPINTGSLNYCRV